MPVLKIKKEDGTWGVIAGGNNVEVDTSLSIEGMAADAKVVGDAIENLSLQIEDAGSIDIDLSGSNEGEANLLNADTLGGKLASEFATLDNIEALRQEILGGAW